MADSAKKRDSRLAAFEHACGATIRAWANIERTLVFYLMVFLQTNDQFRVRIIWASLPNFQSRRKLLNRLAETYLDDAVLPEYRKLMKRVSRLAHNRNLIAHAAGGFYVPFNKVRFFSDDDDKEAGFSFLSEETFDLNNVLRWPVDLDNLGSDLMTALTERFAPAVYTSSRTHRAQPDDRGRHSDPRPEESTHEEHPPPPPPSQE
jgi:hypothetical protein